MNNKSVTILLLIFCSIFITTCKKPKKEMVVSTGTVIEYSANSVKVSGQIIDLGEGAIKYGHCYGTTPDANIKSSALTNNGEPNKTGDFTSELINLEGGITYYVKAYISDGEEPVYGSEINFTLCAQLSAPAVGTITQPTCAAATGSVTLSGLPSSGTWTLTRTPGGTTTTGTGTSTTVSGLPAGTTYTFTVTNASGCVSATSGNVTINTQPASPSAPVVGAITQPTCSVATGSVVLSGLPSSGTWTLTRIPSGTTTSGTGVSTTVTGLPSGTYTFTVTNASGCVSVASANVVINANLSTPTAPTVGTITQPTCTVATGSVVLNGLPAGNWTLTRTPGGTTTTGTGTSTTVTGLPAGATYTFTVTNASGCVSSASGNVVINAIPTTPSATTGAPTSVGTNTAAVNGIVNAKNASSTVTFEYGTNTNYGSLITATQSPVSGNSNNSVSATITGLSSNTEYHFRVRAVNCAGTNYGSDGSFTTSSGCSDSYEPNNTISTANTTAFSTLGTGNYTNTITGTIDISSDVDYYRLNITTPGIITITSYSPGADRDITLYDANGVTIDYSVQGFRELIIYPITITGYYYISVWGGVYSCMTYNLDVTWGPGANTGTFTDYRDGHVYDFVLIGTQIWMAENLNVGTRINGSQNQTANGVIDKYCYNDNESNCNTYGGLYQWDEMMQYSTYEMARGICPEGWHIPSDNEWKTLEMSLGMSQTAADATGWRGTDEGGKLKSTSGLWQGDNVGATNSSHFAALPSGDRISDGTFEALGLFTDFWTSTINTETQSIWYRLLDSEHATIFRTRGDRRYGTPLRCIMNYGNK